MLRIKDNLLRVEAQKAVNKALVDGWEFGWASRAGKDPFKFWHRHFAGAKSPDHPNLTKRQDPYDCTAELKHNSLIFYALWAYLAPQLKGHRLVRCYANCLTYGSDGTLHTDSADPKSFTIVYYPHERWSPNWGGETVFFNKEETDVIGCVYPKPNRLVIFSGVLPHVARGVSRMCPVPRITLMFKTDLHG